MRSDNYIIETNGKSRFTVIQREFLESYITMCMSFANELTPVTLHISSTEIDFSVSNVKTIEFYNDHLLIKGDDYFEISFTGLREIGFQLKAIMLIPHLVHIIY